MTRLQKVVRRIRKTAEFLPEKERHALFIDMGCLIDRICLKKIENISKELAELSDQFFNLAGQISKRWSNE